MIYNISSRAELQSILKENPLVVVAFLSAGCGACINARPKIESLGEKWVVVIVNVNKFSDGVTSVPTVRIYQNGTKLYEKVGFDKQKFLTELVKYEVPENAFFKGLDVRPASFEKKNVVDFRALQLARDASEESCLQELSKQMALSALVNSRYANAFFSQARKCFAKLSQPEQQRQMQILDQYLAIYQSSEKTYDDLLLKMDLSQEQLLGFVNTLLLRAALSTNISEIKEFSELYREFAEQRPDGVSNLIKILRDEIALDPSSELIRARSGLISEANIALE